MGSITENKERIGSFTSSEIYKLIKKGAGNKEFSAPGLTYIEEKRLELKLKRSLGVEAYSKPMAWGKFMEMYVFNLIGIEYEITSNETDKHPKIKYWSGSKDLIVVGKKVSDIKCYQPKKFAQYTDALLKGDVEAIKNDFPAEYWQLVSNAIINDTPNAEAITFMPYESELEEIREMAANYDGSDQWKYRFIAESDKSELAYLPNDCDYKNLNVFEFVIPLEDKIILTERVKLAIKELLK